MKGICDVDRHVSCEFTDSMRLRKARRRGKHTRPSVIRPSIPSNRDSSESSDVDNDDLLRGCSIIT